MEKNLVLDFPECLYFWTPNFHFGRFLRMNYPWLAPYRPLLADILRYDFQIDEALASVSRSGT